MKLKAFFLFAVLSLLSFTAEGQTYVNISKNEALELVRARYADQEVNYFVSSSSMSPSQSYWDIFVDEHPNKGWMHECESYIVLKQCPEGMNPIVYSNSFLLPPSDKTYIPLSVYNPYGNHSTDKPIVNTPTSPINGIGNINPNNVYAVIISGGVCSSINYERYWNDCSFLYKTLVQKFSLPKNQIMLLVSDGMSSGADMLKTVGNTIVSSPHDYDDDGYDEYVLSATKSNVLSILDSLATIMTTNDHLLLYVIDHGGLDNSTGNAYICLWNYGTLYDWELADKLDDFNVKSMNIVLGQCYSGGFIEELADSCRVVTTACTANESSWACDNIPYDEFVYHWTSAINGYNAYGVSVYSDINYDKKTTMYETFNYAVAHDTRNETPQISTIPAALSSELSINDLRDIDLFIRDHALDTGLEPTNFGCEWLSPDIWIRNGDDGIAIQEDEPLYISDPYGTALNTYVKIHNRGSRNYDGSNLWLHLYWADANVGLDYSTWAGLHNTDSITGGPCLPMAKKIPAIAAGDSVIMRVMWVVPEELIERIQQSGNNRLHICHIASISSDQSGCESAEELTWNGTSVYVNAKRTLAQHNATIYNNAIQARQELPLVVGNIYDDDREFNIEIIPAKGTENLANRVETVIKLPELMYKGWADGGSISENVSSYSSAPEIFYLQPGNSKLDRIKLKGNKLFKMNCSFNVIANEEIERQETYEFDIVLRDKKDGRIVGGERIMIRQSPRKAILPKAIALCSENRIVLEASGVDESCKYEWYDEFGVKIAEGQFAVVDAAKSKEYRLKVIAEKDGAVNYTRADLLEKGTNSIASVSPLPFKSQLEVRLKKLSFGNTQIKLTSVSNPAITETHNLKREEYGITLSTAHLSKGTYLVSLLQDGSVADTKKVVHE